MKESSLWLKQGGRGKKRDRSYSSLFLLMWSLYPGAFLCGCPLISLELVSREEQQHVPQAWLQAKEEISQGPPEFMKAVE